MLHDGSSAAHFLRAPEAELLEMVATASRAQLVKIYRLGVVCRCGPVGNRFGLIEARCEGDGVPVRRFRECLHDADNTLPLAVQGVILQRLFPVYREPALDSPSDAASYRQRLDLMADRFRRRRAISHPLDAQKPDRDGLAAGLGIKTTTRSNGDIIELGVVQIQGPECLPSAPESTAGKACDP